LSLKNRTQQQKHTNEIREFRKTSNKISHRAVKRSAKTATNCENDEAHLRAQTLRMGLPFFTTIQIQDTIAETSRV
jgi:hypothetical protein